MHPSLDREIPVREPAPRIRMGSKGRRIPVAPARHADSAPLSQAYSPFGRGAGGEGLRETIQALDAQVYDAMRDAVDTFRAANPPRPFTSFPSALSAGQSPTP
jgi:hypothetical protein